jgi:hypothetical protein
MFARVGRGLPGIPLERRHRVQLYTASGPLGYLDVAPPSLPSPVLGRGREQNAAAVVEVVMRPASRWTLALLALALSPFSSILGCDCGPPASARACEKISTAGVVFLGTVIAVELEQPNLPVRSGLLYRFQVEAAYKGLPPDMAQIVVDPDNITSCGTKYKLGVRYLIFANKLEGRDAVLSNDCAGSREADQAAEDLLFLEAYRRNEAVSFVYGVVLQGPTSIERPPRDEDAPIPGARVVLRNSTQTLTQRTTQDGKFRFESLPPGTYELSADLAPYMSSPLTLETIVPSVGCVGRFPRLEARASISGVMKTEDGLPAPKMMVELLRRNRRGVWLKSDEFRKETDSDGRFKFDDLPDGDYLLGYEIWRDRPSPFLGHQTRYFPGVRERASASVLHLDPMQAMNDLNFGLARPDTPRSIRVEVVWPDGTVPDRNLLQLSDGEELLRNVGGYRRDHPAESHKGIVEFSGYAEREYRLRVRFWIDGLGGPVPHDRQRIALSDEFRLAPGKEPATVRLVLTKTLLAGEER